MVTVSKNFVVKYVKTDAWSKILCKKTLKFRAVVRLLLAS